VEVETKLFGLGLEFLDLFGEVFELDVLDFDAASEFGDVFAQA
jgi:hypothetical protein